MARKLSLDAALRQQIAVAKPSEALAIAALLRALRVATFMDATPGNPAFEPLFDLQNLAIAQVAGEDDDEARFAAARKVSTAGDAAFSVAFDKVTA